MLPAINWIKPAEDSRFGPSWHVASLLFFFPFTLTGRLLFRADSPEQAWNFVAAVFSKWPGPVPGWVDFGHLATLSAGWAFMFIYQLLQYRTNDLNVVYQFPTPVRGVFYAGLFLAIVVFGRIHGSAFIYFQF
jgi:hypothetical protein